jgi:endonuclease YncB( thermonuclease family)
MSTLRILSVLVIAAPVGGPMLFASPAAAKVGPSSKAKVVKVLDGDSVRVKLAKTGSTGRIDLVGVKAPTGTACFASESTAALKKLLPVGAQITFRDELAVGGRGRYVTRGAKFVNAEMLKSGSARVGSLSKLARATMLKQTSAAAQQSRKGLFAKCVAAGDGTGTPSTGTATTPGTDTVTVPTPAAGDPATTADRLKAALSNTRLTDLRTDSQTSTRNDTAFCGDGRAERREQFFQVGGGGASDQTFDGSWRIDDTAVRQDGSIAATVSIIADDTSMNTRKLTVVLGTDGKVRNPNFNASDQQVLQGACPQQPASQTVDNDSQAARDGFLQALIGGRFVLSGRQTDFCASGATRREGGQIVAAGTPVVEWGFKVSDQTQTGRVGVIRIVDVARKSSRRLLLALLPDGTVLTSEFGVDDPSGTDAATATNGAASC